MSVTAALADTAELGRIIRAADPSARLVPQRLVRRALRWQYDLRTSGNSLPHDFAFEIDRGELLECMDAANLDTTEQLPGRVLLLPLPESEDEQPVDELLCDYWQRLFHAALDRAIDATPHSFTSRPDLFNATLRFEIRQVLSAERRLPPPEDDRTLFREFAATYLEWTYFAPSRVAVAFPGIFDPDAMAEWLRSITQAEELFAKTRLEGAAAPGLSSHADNPANAPSYLTTPPSDREVQIRVNAAAKAMQRGNDVRAAVLFQQTQRFTEAEQRLRSLVARLTTALQSPAEEAAMWGPPLRQLLDHATSQGFWDVDERLLYELQKACLDIERPVYAVDIVEWVITRGGKPIRRLLDKPREVNVLRRLRAALKFCQRSLLPELPQEQLLHLLEESIHRVAGRVREANRPIIAGVLDGVGLRAINTNEAIAGRKIVEELLDVLCERGFLKMSDLRDAIARNQLKLNNLTVREFATGDALLRANRLLANRMDGIYRRGEIYMRALQKGSSLAFGTSVGRWLVLFLILPFGSAFVLLEGLHHFIEAISGLVRFFVRNVVGDSGTSAPAEHHGSLWTAPPTIVLVGLLLLGLIHLPGFRAQVGQCARIVLYDWPMLMFRSPWVRLVFNNRVTRFTLRYLLTPLLVGGSTLVLMRFLDVEWDSTATVSAGAALLTGTMFRTRWGRGIEERFDETMSRFWRVVSVNFLIGLLTLIMQAFQRILEALDKTLYAVDEWLRFRQGESVLSVAFKLVFGTVWFIFAYIFRFAWNLLIEPQINPIKHFPVVTVSHKLLLPLIPSLSKTFNTQPAEMGLIVSGIPGIFGFLVWECKENWRLYKSNRSKSLGPVVVGSHGERVRGLLRPGFHSGVIPKTFAKWRKAQLARDTARAAKMHHQLEHVAETMEHLVERELIDRLEHSRRWSNRPVELDGIDLATNRIRIVLSSTSERGALVISIEERGGYLIGSIEHPGWLPELAEPQRSAFEDALVGLYKLAGVHFTREQASAVLGVESTMIDATAEGLVLLSPIEQEISRIDDVDGPDMVGRGPLAGKVWPKRDLLLSEREVARVDWINRWEEDAASESLVGDYRVLPERF